MNYDFIIEHEGKVPYMYLDSVGMVTVGVGHAIPNPLVATMWPGWSEPDRVVAQDWKIVHLAESGKAARAYEHLTKSRLSEETILYLLERDASSALHVVKTNFLPGLDTYPESVRVAMCDMAFNMGPGFLAKFPKFHEAVLAGDWKAAAREAIRPQVASKRNEWTVAQFEAA